MVWFFFFSGFVCMMFVVIGAVYYFVVLFDGSVTCSGCLDVWGVFLCVCVCVCVFLNVGSISSSWFSY